MRKVKIMLVAVICLVAGSLSAQVSFDGCGRLIEDVEGSACVFFTPDWGGTYVLNDYGDFGPGDYVHVTGTINWFDAVWCGTFQLVVLEVHGISECPPCCVNLTGNIDGDPDDMVDIADVTQLISFLFMSGPHPQCKAEANVDGGPPDIIDIGDLTALIDFLFVTNTQPAACPDGGSDPTWGIVDHTGCKGFEGGESAVDTTLDMDCIEYAYDGKSVLSIKHINAGFNCCPVIAAHIDFEGNTIIIEELDSLFNGGCACLCLFDVDYEIGNLPPREYRIIVIEPYRYMNDPVLDFTVDLSSSPSGIHCVERTQYPWGYYE